MFSQYWSTDLGIGPATVLLLLLIILMNACGVRVSIAGLDGLWRYADLYSYMATLSGFSNGLKSPS